jgi:DNA-binding NtrC family response regulator
LLEYHWPGNLRELRAVMARAVAIAPRDVIDAKHLLLPAHASVELAAPQDESLDAVEWQHIQVVLERTGRHQGRAAERLGISAKTLYRKIREYGVPRDESAGSV